MKKLFSFILILGLFCSVAYSQTYTPNLNLAKPARGSVNWDTLINGNFDKLDTWASNLSTQNSGSSTITAGATIALAGNSGLGNDGNLLGLPTITVTAVNCNGTVCIMTNSGNNGLSAGDWIDTYGFSSPSFLNGHVYTTGISLFQIISTGLSSTQFEFVYTSNTGTGTGGTVIAANGYLSTLIANSPSLSTRGKFFTSYSLIGDLATVAAGGSGINYPLYYHPISPAVTGIPGYFILMGDPNIFLFAGGYCKSTLSGYETMYQSVWNQAHADGWIVIQATTIYSNYYTNGSSCTNDGKGVTYQIWEELNDWIRGQGKTPENQSTGYYDRLIDLAPAVNSEFNTIVDGAAYYPNGVSLVSGLVNQAMGNFQHSSIALNSPCVDWTNCFNLNDSPVVKGSPSFENITVNGNNYNFAIKFAVDNPSSVEEIFPSWAYYNGQYWPVDVWQSTNISGSSNKVPMIAFSTRNSNTVNVLGLRGNEVLGWGSDTDNSGSSISLEDTGFSRDSAGVVDLGNGNQSDASGTLKLTHIITSDCTGCSGSGGGVTGGNVSVASGTQAANTCSTNATATDTGLTTSGANSRVVVSYAGDPSAITGWGTMGGMVFQAWESAKDTVTWHVCNQTGSSITYGSITVNLGAN